MALTPTIEGSQSAVRTLNEPDGNQQISQVAARSLINFPTPEMQGSQAAVRNVVQRAPDMEVSQAVVRVLFRGRTEDKQARAWRFIQDGHEFYVLNLGEEGTLTYDRATQQWHSWASADRVNWRPRTGLNWRGKAYAGDDTYGLVYTLEPTLGLDESPIEEGVFFSYQRQVTGIIPLRGRTRARLNGVRLTINNGEPILGLAAITLRYSDDQGKTFRSAGTINVAPNNTKQEFLWRSLGAMRPPGRMFLFEDRGATIRIDGADVDITGGDE